jgi:uncharacterized protein
MDSTTVLSMASHRMLPLRGDDVAVLADRSTGWCIVRKPEYDTLINYLADGNRTLANSDPKNRQVLTTMWDAGLLLANKQPHPDTVPTPQAYPDALLLKLTGGCNFDCSYCYDYDAKRFKARLDFERIKEIISFLLTKREKLGIVFHGGEPLLRFNLVQETVEYALQQAGSAARVGFAIQTNGSRFDDQVISFLEEYNFSVGISLDGATEESNALRTVRRGPTPLEYVKALLDKYPGFVRNRCGFLAVVSRTSAPHLPDFALWLQDQGISGLSFSFLDLIGRGETLVDERLTPDEAVDLYKRLVSMIRSGEIRDLALKSIIGRIRNLFTFQPRDLCHKGPCGAAGEFLVLDAEGGLRSCDCIYNPFFVLGGRDSKVPENSQHSARIALVDRHQRLRDSGPQCSKCSLFGLCGGTCVAKAIAHHGRADTVDPVECALALYIYPELLQEFADGGRMPLFEYFHRHRHAAPDFSSEKL